MMLYGKWNHEKSCLDQAPLSIQVDASWLPIRDGGGSGDDVVYRLSEDAILECRIEVPKDHAARNRTKRNQRLADSDWTQLPDVPLTTKDAWATYRQALRDLPDHVNWPNLEEADWPVVLN